MLTLTVLVGGAIVRVLQYATDSETIAELIRRESPRYFPGCRVDVLEGPDQAVPRRDRG